MVVMTAVETDVECVSYTSKEESHKDTENDPSHSTTLYNFGYAPVEVIERFQWFCFKYSTLAEAIDALLERDKFLIHKYRFMTPPVLYQMMAKPTENDLQVVIKKSMMTLHKYTKEGRYKSVADAIEELLISPELLDIALPGQGNYSKDGENLYTMVSPAEEEALSKIADALFNKVVSMAPTGSKKTKQRKVNSPKKDKTLDVAVKSNASSTKQAKAGKLFISDPDYNPDLKQDDFVWTNKKQLITSLSAHKDIHDSNRINPEHLLLNAPDHELNIPLHRFTDEYVRPMPKRLLLHSCAMLEAKHDPQSDFMLNSLQLLPNKMDFEILHSMAHNKLVSSMDCESSSTVTQIVR
uniref:Uncharacterized protein LOC100181269 n=1 Tax=Phallusia mammillata TaxID=59560 RepID=A0A6F9DI57_9ASCI|nr:uncharacterized protein LOC100181269 [Phallusia mammillata]